VDDESAQLGALTELCEVLSISSEDTLASFPIESAAPMLVSSVLPLSRVWRLTLMGREEEEEPYVYSALCFWYPLL